MNSKKKYALEGGLLNTVPFHSINSNVGTLSYLDITTAEKVEVKENWGQLPVTETVEISLGVKREHIKVETHKAETKISHEQFMDLDRLGISLKDTVTDVLYHKLKMGTEKRIYELYVNLGKESKELLLTNWQKTFRKYFKISYPSYVTADKINTFILSSANKIAKNTRIGPGNFAIVSSKIFSYICEDPSFEFFNIGMIEKNDVFGAKGKLGNIVIYTNLIGKYDDNTIVVGRIPKENEPGIHYVEYFNEFIEVAGSEVRDDLKIMFVSHQKVAEIGRAKDWYLTDTIIIGKKPWWRKLLKL